MSDSALFDLLVVGAGPTGLACAIEAQKSGLTAVLVDKGCVCNSLFHYPAHMTFFTTSELLEIGGIPFPSINAKPNRNEALEYYRLVAAFYKLDIRQYLRVDSISGSDGAFTVHSVDRFDRSSVLRARKLVIATGYYDLPNWMNIPGENLGKVHHYYNDPHPFYGLDVAVIGGKNSAAIAALELWRHGARVTLIYRGPGVTPNVKYWIKPDIENRIKAGEVTAYFHTDVVEITPDTLLLETPDGPVTLHNDFVFAMTGYHPDFTFLERLGVRLEGPDKLPACDPKTLESNVPGIYLAGVVVAGSRTSEIFIENGRFHGRQIADALSLALKR
jgi:thioredoxin reductase (NADPH)